MAHFKNYKIFFHFPIPITEVFQNILKKALQTKKILQTTKHYLNFVLIRKITMKVSFSKSNSSSSTKAKLACAKSVVLWRIYKNNQQKKKH